MLLASSLSNSLRGFLDSILSDPSVSRIEVVSKPLVPGLYSVLGVIDNLDLNIASWVKENDYLLRVERLSFDDSLVTVSDGYYGHYGDYVPASFSSYSGCISANSYIYSLDVD